MFGLGSLRAQKRYKYREMRRASEKLWLRVERKTILGKKILWILAEDQLSTDFVLNEQDYRPQHVRQSHRPVELAPLVLEAQP